MGAEAGAPAHGGGVHLRIVGLERVAAGIHGPVGVGDIAVAILGAVGAAPVAARPAPHPRRADPLPVEVHDPPAKPLVLAGLVRHQGVEGQAAPGARLLDAVHKPLVERVDPDEVGGMKRGRRLEGVEGVLGVARVLPPAGEADRAERRRPGRPLRRRGHLAEQRQFPRAMGLRSTKAHGKRRSRDPMAQTTGPSNRVAWMSMRQNRAGQRAHDPLLAGSPSG